jgi:hypothetical protein
MDSRKPRARPRSIWSALCTWYLRRDPFPPDYSLRLLTFFSKITGLPRPCPAVIRR